MRGKCHRHLWLLSGTGDGPPLAKTLLSKGWNVSVSVVSSQAALSYSQLPLQSLMIGALDGKESIRKTLEKAKVLHKGFDWIIDATHPFAEEISSNLKTVCLDLDQPLVCFERTCKTIEEATLIQSFDDLRNFDLTGQNLLLAIGSRFLSEAVEASFKAGATVFARVLPTVQGISKALSSGLPHDHLAVVRPLKGDIPGEYEAALCRRWKITGVVSRQSGGSTQKLWQKITKEKGLNLWLMSRPKSIHFVPTFDTFSAICDYILK